MSTQTTDRQNQGWRSNDNRFRIIKLKGIDTQVFKDGELLQYDPADDTFVQYTGALAADLVRGILSLGVGEEITLDVADTLEPAASMCIEGEVISDFLVFPGAVTIDARPNGAILSVREQLREVGIIARDADLINENHIS